MKKTIQPLVKSFGNWKRSRRYTILAKWNRSLRLAGVTLCSMALLTTGAFGQGSVEYTDDQTSISSSTALDITIADGATLFLNSGEGELRDPNLQVLIGSGGAAPAITMNGASTLQLFADAESLEAGDSALGADEVFSALNSGTELSGSAATDSLINIGRNKITLALDAVEDIYTGRIVATDGGVVDVTSGSIEFNGNANSLDLANGVHNCEFDWMGEPDNNPISLRIANGATVETVNAGTFVNSPATSPTALDATGASVLVGGTLTMQGAETLLDLWVENGGLVEAMGGLEVTDYLRLEDGATLDVGGALCIDKLEADSGSTLVVEGDFLWGLTAASQSSGVELNIGSNDFVKTRNGNLTLETNQEYTGATWVQSAGLTLEGTSDSLALIVTGDVESADAVGTPVGTGGEVYSLSPEADPAVSEDNNIDYADIVEKAGNDAPVLTLEATSEATEITVGSDRAIDLDSDGVADTASLATTNADILNDEAQVSVFNSGNVTLGGDEVFKDLDFADTVAPADESVAGATQGALTLGGVTCIDTLESATIGNGVVNLGIHSLYIGDYDLDGVGADFTYDGIFTGTVDSNLLKIGDGEVVLTQASAGMDGEIFVQEGILDIRTGGALGSTNGATYVQRNAELELSGVTVGDDLFLKGFGTAPGTTGAVSSLNGNNTVNGDVFIEGSAAFESRAGGLLTIAGDVNELATYPVGPLAGVHNINQPAVGFTDTGTIETLFLAGAGNTRVSGLIGGGIEELYKAGTGTADISGNDHQYGVRTMVQDGSLLIDDVNNLGAAATTMEFVGDTNNAGEVPILNYTPAAVTNQTLGRDIIIDSELARSPYRPAITDQELDVATFDINDNDGTAGNSSLAIELDANGPGNTRISIADPTSAIYKTGEDTLILNALNSTVAPAVAGEGTLPGDLLPVDVVLGGVLNPAEGGLQVNGPGEAGLDANCFGAIAGASNFEISGLGVLDELAGVGGSASAGDLVITGFDNLVINQSTNTTFLGTINGSSNFVYDGNGNVQTLGAVGTGFTGNFYIGNGRLVASEGTSLGSFVSDFDSQATFVCGTHQETATSIFDPAAALNFGILAVAGDTVLSENITLINDGHLVNQSGTNAINTAVRLAYDPTTDVLPGDAAYATIGSEDGTLTLQNGVFNETGTNVGLRLNTGTVDRGPLATAPEIAHNGILELGAIARDSVQDIVIGHSGSSGTTVLLAANAHEGQTFLNGGTVEARDSGAFSAGNVIVDGASALNGTVSLANNIQLNAELTTTTDDSNLRLDGEISGVGSLVKEGTGTLTLAGNNLYTGSTTIEAGILDSFNSLASQEIDVNDGTLNARGTLAATDVDVSAGGNLNTFGDEFLSNAAAVNVDGMLTLGGNETISALTGLNSGAVEIAANNLTVSSGSFAGGINGTGDLIKDGNGTLTLGGTNSYTGETEILDGVLDVNGGSLASNEITVSNNATLRLQNGAEFAPDSELVNDGLVEVTGENEIGQLFGSATGVIDIGNSASDELTVLGGVYNGDIVGAGSLVKDGSGSLVLNNGSSHTGATNVEAGSLRVGGALASSSVDVSQNATLQTDRSELLADTASVNVDGTLSLGGDERIGQLTGGASGTVAVGDNTLAVDNGGNFGGNLTGSGDLASSGDLTLSGDSTLNGNLDVTDGTLSLSGSIDSTDIDVSNGATLALSGANSLEDSAAVNVGGTLSVANDETVGTLAATGNVTGAGTLTATTYDLNGADVSADLGTGVLNSSGATSLTGTSAASDVNVTGGNLTLSGANRLANDADVSLVGNLNLGGDETIGNLSGTGGVITTTGEVLSVSSGDYDGVISGAGGLTKDNEGTLSLSANQIFTGATQINGGTVQLDGTLASTNVTVDGGSLVLGSAERINDAAALTVRGNGLLVLNGDETVATANLGTQSVSGTGNLIAGTTTLAGTTLDTGLDSSGIVSTGTSGTATTINAASSATSLVVADETTLLLNAAFDTDSIAVNGPAGVLTTGSGNLINDTAVVDIDGTLNLEGDETIGGLTGIGNINVGNNTLEVDGDGTFGGELAGSGNLVTGGDLTLSGESSLSGDLDVEDGTLALTGSIDSSNVDVDSDAVLALSNGGSLQDDSAVNVNGTLTLVDDETIGSLAASGAVNGAGTLTAETYELDGATVGANLGAGSLTSSGATILNGTSAASAVDVESGTLTLGSANRLDDSAAVKIDGTLALNGDNTVGVVDASGSISGSGTLTASAYNLDGAIVSANLGAGVLNSTGNTQLDGTSAAAGVNVIDGMLTLGSAQRLLNTAVVDVDGNLVLGGAETIGELTGTGAVDAGGHTFTIADGGDFSGGVSGTGSLVSNGALSLTGENSFSGDLDVNTGRFDLVGRIAASTVDVDRGAVLALRGLDSLSDSTDLNVDGTLGVNDDETVGSLSASGTIGGDGTLTAATYDLVGATVDAGLGTGILNTSGTTSLNGTGAAGTVNVLGGTLVLGDSERLLDTATVVLNGDLNLGGNETIGALSGSGDVVTVAGETFTVSSGTYAGDITGAGALAKNGTGTLTLSNGSSYSGETMVNSGNLALGDSLASDEVTVQTAAMLTASLANALPNGVDLTADGNVSVIDETLGSLRGSGMLTATSLEVQSGNFDGALSSTDLTVGGNLVSNGSLSATNIELEDGSTLTLNGEYDYQRFEGSGTVGANVFEVADGSTIAPEGSGVGTIAVNGDFTQYGTYEADITAIGSDTLTVAGVASIDLDTAILDVDDPTGVTDPLGSRVNIVNAAGGIEGGYSDITGNASARLLFDTANGDVTSLGIDAFADLDENQLAVVNEILDSSIDGVNFDSDSEAGEILDTFILNGGADGLDDSLNSLSPEAYAGGLDHVMIATRQMAFAVRNAPALVVVGADQSVMEELPGDSKGRGYRPAFSLPDNIALEIIGGYTGFSLGSDSSQSGNDYDIQSNGGYAGFRLHTADGLLSAASYIGFDGASIDGNNVNLDGDGIVWGAYASVRPTQDRKLEFWSELAYGTYEYDATRSSVGGVSSGDAEASAFEFGLGASYLAFQRDGFSLSPATGLRYVNGSMDSISETGGIGALEVDAFDATSVLFDLGLQMAFVPTQNDKFGFTGYLGWQHDFSETERDVSAAFAGGESFSVTAPGLGADAFIYNIGAYYDVTDNIRLGASYRGEFRDQSQVFQGFGLNGSIGF